MGSVTGKNISFNELCELIDLYKRVSIDGDRISLIVQPQDSSRLITIKLKNGYSIKATSYLFEDGNLFDNDIYPELLSVLVTDDSIGNWTISSINDGTYLGTIETQTGNTICFKTSNDELFKTIKNKIEIRKGKLTNQDRVWEEILLYAKNRKILKDVALTEEELDSVYIFIVNLATNDLNVKCGNLKENEKYLKELFDNREEMLKNGLTEDILNKMNPVLIKQLAIILENEKRIRFRLNIDDINIKGRIQFASFELDGCGYFNINNRITKETPTIRCKIEVISKLLSKMNHSNLYDEVLRDIFTGYCYEVIAYLYRKGTKIDIGNKFDSIEFKEYVDTEEKNTNELSSKEIEEIISSIEETKSSSTSKNELFTIVKTKEEKQDSYEILEIKDAYEKSLNYSTETYPAWIKIMFEDNNDEADVIISNKSGGHDLVLYRRPVSIDKLKGEIMDTLRNLFTKNNSIHYNIKYKSDNTNNSSLLMVGDKRTTFSIVNGPDEFVDYNKKKLEELMG